MTQSPFDPTDSTHAKALGMLQRDRIAWIVTITSGGEPRAVPVWFLWHDGVVSILSEPGAHKVAHVRRGSPVLLHLQAGGEFGDDVVVLRGAARVLPEPSAAWLERHRGPYIEKYAASIEAFGMPAEEMVEKFSVVIELTPEHVLAW